VPIKRPGIRRPPPAARAPLATSRVCDASAIAPRPFRRASPAIQPHPDAGHTGKPRRTGPLPPRPTTPLPPLCCAARRPGDATAGDAPPGPGDSSAPPPCSFRGAPATTPPPQPRPPVYPPSRRGPAPTTHSEAAPRARRRAALCSCPRSGDPGLPVLLAPQRPEKTTQHPQTSRKPTGTRYETTHSRGNESALYPPCHAAQAQRSAHPTAPTARPGRPRSPSQQATPG
jgi:hypothetical protein